MSLSLEIIPLHKLLPWKRGSVNSEQRKYSRCPQAATLEYERRRGTDVSSVTRYR